MRRRGIRLVAVAGLARVDGQPYGRCAPEKGQVSQGVQGERSRRAHPERAYFGHACPIHAPWKRPLTMAQALSLLAQARSPNGVPTSCRALMLSRWP